MISDRLMKFHEVVQEDCLYGSVRFLQMDLGCPMSPARDLKRFPRAIDSFLVGMLRMFMEGLRYFMMAQCP